MSADPFAKWAAPTVEEEAPVQEDIFAKWREPAAPTAERRLPGEELIEQVDLPRQAARASMRFLETFGGIPRSLAELGEIPSELLVKGLEKIGVGTAPRKALETAKKYAPYKLLPQTEQLREFSRDLFGEHFEPKNRTERFADEVATDFAALAFPVPGAQVKAMRPLLTALGANVLGEGAEAFGFGKTGKGAIKLGTMMLGSLYNPRGAENYKNMLYEAARDARPADATVSTNVLRRQIDKIRTNLKKGGIAPSDKPAMEKLNDLEGLMEGAQIPVEQLERFKIKVNEELGGIYQRLEGNRPGIRSAKRNLENVAKAADDALTLYGTQNPEWGGLYRSANQAHGAIAQSKRAMNFIKKQSGKLWKPVGAYFGLEKFVPGVPKLFGPKVAVPAAAGLGLVKSGEIAYQIAKSPALRRYYLNVLKGAARENAPVVSQNLKKMNELLDLEE